MKKKKKQVVLNRDGLAPLNSQEACPKCNNTSIGYIYRSPLDAEQCGKLNIELQHGQEGLPEHMMRTCVVCNYRWIEAVADAK